ncbi:MAG: pentapeptide repeat-containing protein [Leptolyngbyaceae bacterium]|nr:pentapeptide repeat-containing protein [Leptolyngbyaceae bacterium]
MQEFVLKSMNPSSDFLQRDWRDRSFRCQDLRQANFEGADVRGCDFRQAQLDGAGFTNARLGRTTLQVSMVLLITMVLLAITFPPLSQMVFAGMGVTRGDPAWIYAVALRGLLAIAGALTGLQQSLQRHHRLRQIMHRGAVSAIALLIGFYYGGSVTDNSPYGAVVGAIVLGAVGVWLGGDAEPRWGMGGLTLVGAIAAYGFCFAAGTTAATLIHAHLYALGMVWAVTSLVYIKWTIDALGLTTQRMTSAMGTCFKSLI